MILSIELKTANVIEAVARESAIKAQLLTDNPAAFERMTVTEGDHVWLTEKILQSAKVFTSVLHPYIDNHIFTDAEFAYELLLEDTFNEMQGTAVLQSVREAITKTVTAEWFRERGQVEIANTLLQEYAALIDQIKSTLYKWRVIRSPGHNDITHAIIVPDGTRKAMFVVIGIASESVINLAAENVNASLKARLPGTEEYEKFRITENELISLERLADKVVDVIAMRAQAYMALWKQDVPVSEVQSVINEIKGEGDVSEDTTPHFLFVFKFPENFNAESARTIASTIKEVISNELSHRYFMEVGLSELSQFYYLKRDNALIDLMSLLHRRTKPIRRRANFFN